MILKRKLIGVRSDHIISAAADKEIENVLLRLNYPYSYIAGLKDIPNRLGLSISRVLRKTPNILN